MNSLVKLLKQERTSFTSLLVTASLQQAVQAVGHAMRACLESVGVREPLHSASVPNFRGARPSMCKFLTLM